MAAGRLSASLQEYLYSKLVRLDSSKVACCILVLILKVVLVLLYIYSEWEMGG